MAKTAATIALNLLMACAGSTMATSSDRPLEANFDGNWRGSSSFATLTGRNAFYVLVPVTISVSGNTARVAGICPTSARRIGQGQGGEQDSMVMTGVGAAAAWSGTLNCKKVDLLGCDAVAVTYSNATMTLTGVNQISIVAQGKAQGCATSYRLVLTFVGSKQGG